MALVVVVEVAKYGRQENFGPTAHHIFIKAMLSNKTTDIKVAQ